MTGWICKGAVAVGRVRLLPLLLMVATSLVAKAQAPGEEVRVRSPEGRAEIRVTLRPFSYTVRYREETVIEASSLGLAFKGQAATGEFKVVGREERSVDISSKPVWGKTGEICNRFRELRLDLVEASGPKRRMSLRMRAYDDGIAFRYELPKQRGMEEFVVDRELTGFRLAGNAQIWASTYKNFRSAYEEEYRRQRVSEVADSALIGLPVLAEIGAHAYVTLMEADLEDWAGLYLRRSGSSLLASLSPRTDGNGLVKASTPHRSPWRVVMLADRPGDLVASNLIENLSEASRIRDTRWIRPGKMMWDHWWSGDVAMENGTIERYIAFAGAMGISVPVDRLAVVWTVRQGDGGHYASSCADRHAAAAAICKGAWRSRVVVAALGRCGPGDAAGHA